MRNSEKMMAAVRDIGISYKKWLDALMVQQEEQEVSVLFEKKINELNELNDLVARIDAIFMESATSIVCDDLDITSLLYYQGIRTKLCMMMENTTKILAVTIANAGDEEIPDATEVFDKLTSAGIESIKKYAWKKD